MEGCGEDDEGGGGNGNAAAAQPPPPHHRRRHPAAEQTRCGRWHGRWLHMEGDSEDDEDGDGYEQRPLSDDDSGVHREGGEGRGTKQPHA